MNGDDDLFLDGSEWSAQDLSEAAPVATVEPPPPAPARPVEKSRVILQEKKRGPEPLYFDIETVGDDSRLSTFNLDPLPPVPDEDDIAKMPDPEDVTAKTVDEAKKFLDRFNCPPGAWLDRVEAMERGKEKPREGVFEAVAKARGKRQAIVELHSERRKLLSTTPEFCRIVSLAWAAGNAVVYSAVVGQVAGPFSMREKPVTERELLELFWTLAASHVPLIGFNILHFDLPVIFVRSAILGVPASRMLDLKPWGRDCCDLFALRFPKSTSGDGRPRRLKALAPLFGIEVPAEDTDGSDVERLLAEDPEKLGFYNRSDVVITRALHKALGGFFWA